MKSEVDYWCKRRTRWLRVVMSPFLPWSGAALSFAKYANHNGNYNYRARALCDLGEDKTRTAEEQNDE